MRVCVRVFVCVRERKRVAKLVHIVFFKLEWRAEQQF